MLIRLDGKSFKMRIYFFASGKTDFHFHFYPPYNLGQQKLKASNDYGDTFYYHKPVKASNTFIFRFQRRKRADFVNSITFAGKWVDLERFVSI
jgi:hypothetical protein